MIVMRRRDAGCGFDGCRGKVRIVLVVVVLYPQMKINGPSLSSSPSRFVVCSRDTRDMRVCVVHDSVSVPAQHTAQHRFCRCSYSKRDSETQEKGDEEGEGEGEWLRLVLQNHPRWCGAGLWVGPTLGRVLVRGASRLASSPPARVPPQQHIGSRAQKYPERIGTCWPAIPT